MYPGGELARLAQRKAILQARIAVRRWECAAAVVELTRPIAQVDRGIEMWQRISPFLKLLAVPAGLIFTRMLTRRTDRRHERKRSKLATILASLPLILRGVKTAMAFRAAYAARTRAPESGPHGERSSSRE